MLPDFIHDTSPPLQEHRRKRILIVVESFQIIERLLVVTGGLGKAAGRGVEIGTNRRNHLKRGEGVAHFP